ncbi:MULTISPECIES: PhoH family protein [unclassified Acinetobacter]|uniref:PhoH family protein n=1 Tax=unclassified Acinetobacter TaxID=196816 RepID=UPI0029348E79|nr:MULTISPECIES: PhoH family protein [unclassified Acinetobacter]WOE31310.1 PhoH family protein [Acinetobacter sp. SAAs470]WOE39506.1 PhoH family protein [Acinetobacter sp. SAAs474]
MTAAIRRTVTFPGISVDRLKSMLGAYNGHLKQIEQRLNVKIFHRGEAFFIDGEIDIVTRAEQLLHRLHEESELNPQITADTLHLIIQGSQTDRDFQEDCSDQEHTGLDEVWLQTRKGRINPRGANQKRYVQRILQSDISFGIGPAGTGKTYLAVAAAVDMLERNEIQRILLVRPAVEAGEKLGFLPGDLTQKIDPYLRPLYDALYEMLGFEKVAKLIERQVIEVAPLAYMRGRTLNHSFVILDEAQNTTPEQMKMFLTRLGFGSRAVITGDVTQVDLPRGQQSGLSHALRVLEPVKEIHITRFHSRDVVRHQLVQKIVEAYEGWDSEQQRLSAQARAERKARQDTLISENDAAADAQHDA